MAAIVLNANIGTFLYDGESDCSDSGMSLPSLLTRQGVDKIPHVWLNGEFHTQLFTQIESEATESPQDLVENDVPDLEPVSTDSDEEEMYSRGYLNIGSNWEQDIASSYHWLGFLSSFSLISKQMSSLVRHVTGGKPVMGCLCWSGGSDLCHASPKSLLFCELQCHPFFVFEFFPPISWPGQLLSLLGDEGDSDPFMRPLP